LSPNSIRVVLDPNVFMLARGTLGNKQIEGQTLGALAYLALDRGRARDAVSMMKDVLRIDRDRSVPLQTSFDLSRFAWILALSGGSSTDAARLLSSAEAIRRRSAPVYLRSIKPCRDDPSAGCSTRRSSSCRGQGIRLAERVGLHQRPAWLCVFLNSQIAARATVAGSGARARSRNLVRAASPHL
jgi:hypothetical protein